VAPADVIRVAGQREGAMTGRVLLAIAILVVALQHAGAQFAGTPGLPGGSGGPLPQCQALLSIRDDLQKHGKAIEEANAKRADVKTACRLFRTYLATEAKMLRMLEVDGGSCGAGAQVIQQVRGSHAKAQQIGKQVCDAAGRGPRLFDPQLPDDPQFQDERRMFELSASAA
jgi:hypothetical protein